MELTKKHLKTYWSEGWGDVPSVSIVLDTCHNLVIMRGNNECFAPLGWYLVSLGSSIYTWFSKTDPMGHSCFALVTLRSEASPLHMCLQLKVSVVVGPIWDRFLGFILFVLFYWIQTLNMDFKQFIILLELSMEPLKHVFLFFWSSFAFLCSKFTFQHILHFLWST